MKLTLLATIAAMALAAPAFAQTTPPRDTGNMAYPTPTPQGTVGSTTPTTGGARDTGSAQFPAPRPQGNLSTTAVPNTNRAPTDTGNMAYPAPQTQGTVGGSTMPK